MPYGETQRLVKDRDDVILVESAFKETTRGGSPKSSVLLALTKKKLLIVSRKLVNPHPRIYYNILESELPLSNVNLTIFKQTRRQVLKARFCNETVKYYELGNFKKRKIFWEIWRNHIRELNRGPALWPFKTSRIVLHSTSVPTTTPQDSDTSSDVFVLGGTACALNPQFMAHIHMTELGNGIEHSVVALKELEGSLDKRTSSLVNTDKFSAVRTVVRHAGRLRSATARPWAEEDVRLFLEGLRFSPECVSELTALLCSEQIYQNIPLHMRVKPAVTALSWRIDLSLAAPRVILAMELSDGLTKTYRLSVAKFHELRFAVASALKSVIVLERRKCMRRD